MLSSFTINMDPSNYRRLYRDKAFRENLNLPSAEGRFNVSNLPTPAMATNTSQITNAGGQPANSAVGRYKVRQSGQLSNAGLEELLQQVPDQPVK